MRTDLGAAAQPAWQFTRLGGSVAAVSSHPSGRWTVVRRCGTIEGASLEDVLRQALVNDTATEIDARSSSGATG